VCALQIKKTKCASSFEVTCDNTSTVLPYNINITKIRFNLHSTIYQFYNGPIKLQAFKLTLSNSIATVSMSSF